MRAIGSRCGSFNFALYRRLGETGDGGDVSEAESTECGSPQFIRWRERLEWFAAGQSYPFQYQYNLAGGLKQMTYPSVKVVAYNHDEAGRISEVTGYASNITYTAHGAVKQMQLGNQLWEWAEYDPARLQVKDLRLGTTAGSYDRWRLQNDYGTTANNGNVRSQTLTGAGLNLAQSFGYDPLNRLQSATEGTAWSRTFDYDRFGNGWVNGWTGLSPGSFTPLSAAWYDTRNRITGAPSAQFDAAGNQTQLGGYSFQFDAENRLKSSTINNVTTAYGYDGEGRRVRKVSGSDTTVFVYDAFGQLAAEYSTQPPATAGSQYITTDHLGSMRVVTNASGAVTSCHDYLPFGKEIPAGVNGRPSCYGTPGPTQKFTGKERDQEMGLDYFGARYYSPAQGRWTSPDLINLTWDRLGNPSNTLNKYVYAANSPLKFVDPDGQDITLFYQPSASSTNLGDYGHAFLAAYDQSTNQVEFLDYYPEDRNNLQLRGGEFVGPGTFNTGTFNERRSGFASLTIQTTPEVTQKVMAFMRDFKARKPTYSFPWSSTCVTACRAALEVAGIRVSAYSPAGLWRAFCRRYSPSYRMMLGDGKSVMPPITSRPGVDSGSPRTDPMEWQRFLFNLWLQQIERQREEEERKRREREYEPPGYGR